MTHGTHLGLLAVFSFKSSDVHTITGTCCKLGWECGGSYWFKSNVSHL